MNHQGITVLCLRENDLSALWLKPISSPNLQKGLTFKQKEVYNARCEKCSEVVMIEKDPGLATVQCLHCLG